MSSVRLSPAAQLRYMLQWFEEWSELQRQDFLPLLAAKLSRPPAVLNELVQSVAAVNCSDKPMSLFQCRIKLFNEWYPTWGNEERSRLRQGCSNIDADFGDKLQTLLDAPLVTNGLNGHSDEEVPHDVTPQDNTPEPEEVVAKELSPELESSVPEQLTPEQRAPEEVEEIRETVQESTMALEIVAAS